MSIFRKHKFLRNRDLTETTCASFRGVKARCASFRGAETICASLRGVKARCASFRGVSPNVRVCGVKGCASLRKGRRLIVCTITFGLQKVSFEYLSTGQNDSRSKLAHKQFCN